MNTQQEIQKIKKMYEQVVQLIRTPRRLHQSDIPQGVIKQRHIEEAVITTGLATDRPTEGSVSCRAYFATDTFALSIWTGSAWKSTTLS